MKTLAESSCTKFVEMGPGKVLSGLGKRIVDGGHFSAIDSLEDFRKFEKTFKEEAK